MEDWWENRATDESSIELCRAGGGCLLCDARHYQDEDEQEQAQEDGRNSEDQESDDEDDDDALAE